MTCKYSDADWRDVLYNAVRNAPGGVKGAAAFLSERRGRTIHTETLRSRLRGVDGESVSSEMLELLGEYLQDLRRPDALDWLYALNARFGLAAQAVASAAATSAADAAAIRERLLQQGVTVGALTGVGLRVTADDHVSAEEADQLESKAMDAVRGLFELIQDTRRASGKATARPADGGAP